MTRFRTIIACTTTLLILTAALSARDVDTIASKRVVFLGDSITQGGGYVTFTAYYLDRLYPQKSFDIYGLGLASETLSGLSEQGHADGKFPRPCLFERLGRILEKAKPQVVFACYGMNDGIYQPLDPERTAAFQKGVKTLVRQCKDAGVEHIFLITPPIYDFEAPQGEFNYDSVLAEYARWETKLEIPDVHIIDLHTAMRDARAKRKEPFSKDKIHPGEDGHLFMAKTILSALGMNVPDESLAKVKADPIYKFVAEKRDLRSGKWMKHIGYTREAVVTPGPLGSTEADAASIQKKIDALRRQVPD